MTEQLQFSQTGPAEDCEARSWLEQYLYVHPGWHTSPELCSAFDGGLTDRALRSAASSSDIIISSQRGFRHLRRASAEEINHFLHDLASRVRAMQSRHVAVQRKAHEVLG